MTTDRGAKALAERLPETLGNEEMCIADAKVALGEHGLFIRDVTKHEPYVAWDRNGDAYVTCCCGGWDNEIPPVRVQSYFDHIGTQS